MPGLRINEKSTEYQPKYVGSARWNAKRHRGSPKLMFTVDRTQDNTPRSRSVMASPYSLPSTPKSNTRVKAKAFTGGRKLPRNEVDRHLDFIY